MMKFCSIEACEKTAVKRGWCSTHYARWRNNGDPLISGDEPVPCKIDGCESYSKARGWCYNHWKQWQRTGDPLGKAAQPCKNKCGNMTSSKRRAACYDCRKLAHFGITMVDYNRMLKEQNGVCAICFKECGRHLRLSVDHCHKTGKVRGLLCMRCNLALGALDDNVDRMRMALKYMENFS